MNIQLRFRFAIVLYFAVIVSLFLYSFTQIDLSLTFSRIEILRNTVSSFQHIGYFNRPLSAYIYLGLLVLLFGFYFYFLKLARDKKIRKRTVWRIIIVSSAILTFSYNAFSYDLFNYIFDAKIYTHYHLNPYLHKALDFPGDPMLSFMRWTHRVYPYGPVWLFITIPLSYIGSNFFLPTFFLFKIVIASCFLGSLYFIGKIIQKITPEKELLGLVFFGLHPLILIESVVSAHIDIVMMFLALVSFYKLVSQKYLLAIILLVLSIGIKFATAFLIPVFLYIIFLQRRKTKINWSLVISICVVLMSCSVILSGLYSGNFQPWYLILPLSFAVFLANKFYALIPSVIISFLALLNYLPYLYTGNWDPPIPQVLSATNTIGYILSLIAIVVYYIHSKERIKIR